MLIGLCTLFCVLFAQSAYSESYLLSVGESVTITQTAYGGGYIDNVGLADYLDGHLSFTKNYDGSATITVKSYFDYPATVKLVFIERYTYMGHTRKATYYRDITISCKYVAPQPTVKPTKVSLPERIRVSVDEGRVPVTAILEPYGATPTSVSWTKDDGTALFVLDNSESVTCHIRGKSTGIGKLRVHIGDWSEWYYNDDLSASAIVEVYDPQFPFPAGILLPSSYEISKGGHVTLVPVLSPEGTSSSFTWTSSNKNVATVEYGKVTGLSEGKTTITVKTANELVATTEVTVVKSNGKDDEEGEDQNNSGYIDGHEYVDLGLSVKWATCNVGASSPEKTGSKFAWGETSEKTEYTWANYLNGGNTNIGSDIKGTKYDAAYVNWGSKWRMPSETEVKELISKCTCKSLTINGVKGYQITGPNGNSIFIPGDGSIWTSSISSNDEDRARYFYIHLIYNSMGIESLFRFKGLFVRAVTEASGSVINPKLVLSASPSSGQVSAGTKVTLTAKADGSTVSGCDIYYTLNGSTPTKSSTKYTSSGITINSACTLKAIVYKSGYSDSDVLTEKYTIKEDTKPKLILSASPSSGQVSAGTKVTLTVKANGSTVSGCDIYYTLNGSTPTKSSTKYTSAGVTISSNCTLKAIAYKDGYETSNVLTESYTIPTPKKLTLAASPSSGQVASGTKVTLTAKADGSTVSGCDIYYTTNGSTPTKSSTKYTSSGITISSNCTLKAIAYKSGYTDSDVLTETYTIPTPKKLTLSASPSGGQVSAGTTVTLTTKANGSTVSGCDIYYTTNGTTPSKSNGTKYSSGITINSACTLKAIAYKSGYADSDVLTATYTIKPTENLYLYASPSGGEVAKGTVVKLYATDKDELSVSGADIYYTTNGDTPTKYSTKYTSSGIIINSDCTLKAIAYKDGFETSEVFTTTFQIADQSPVKQIVAGFDHSLFLMENSSMWACGGNNSGQLCDGTKTNRHKPTKVMNDIEGCASVARATLFIRNGNLFYSGESLSIPHVYDVTTVFGGRFVHTFFLKKDNTLWADGANSQGELGIGTNDDISSPAKVLLDDVVYASAGWMHSLFVTKDGVLWGCGNSQRGELGEWTITSQPQRIMDNVSSASAGIYYSLILKHDGSVWACGENTQGCLGIGDGMIGYKISPPRLVMEDVAAISAYSHSMFLKKDGTVWTCGSNKYGQLGNGTNTNSYSPVKVMEDVVSISAGNSYSLFLKKDGSVWACGRNNYGQLGDGTTVDRHTPVLIFDGANWVSSSTSIEHISLSQNDNSAPIYSLSGQRLTAPRKGINIVGGKKVIVK